MSSLVTTAQSGSRVVRGGGHSPSRITLSLALADLRHEWLLNLCMIFALAAILTPLLLLEGLRRGALERVAGPIVTDPYYREIRPETTLDVDEKWIGQIAARPDVVFATPTILAGSSIVRIAEKGGSQWEPVDLLPTATGDPLIVENHGVIPRDGEIVISESAAQKVGVKAGDEIAVKVTRTRNGTIEQVTEDLRVSAVLDPRAGMQARVYVPLQLTLDIEDYREGMAVPKRNWPGGLARPYLSFDGIWILTPDALPPTVVGTLTVGTGFAEAKPMSAEELTKQTGLQPPPGLQILALGTLHDPVQWSSVVAVKNKLRGFGAVLLPYTQDRSLRLVVEGGKELEVSVVGVSLAAAELEIMHLPTPPWGVLSEEAPYAEYAQILLPPGTVDAGTTSVVATFKQLPNDVRLPLRVAGESPIARAIVPAGMLGMLRTGTIRKIEFDAAQNELVMARSGFRGFRLYARTIYDVEGLNQALRESGIETVSKLQSIGNLQLLDRGLTRIFWLVAVVGIIGGIAALIASLYAAVERKTRDLGMIRLLGLARRDVFPFPIYQSATIALLASILASGAFLLFSTVINKIFAPDVQMGGGSLKNGDGALCHLPAPYLAVALLATIVAAIISSLFAAWRTTRIEPAEAIRVE